MSLDETRKAMAALAGTPTNQAFANTVLLPAMRYLATIIRTNPMEAIRVMSIDLIGQLSDEDREHIKDLVAKLADMERQPSKYYRSDLYDCQRQLSNFIHVAYLRELGVHPRYGTGGKLGENPDDKHK